MKSFGVVLPKEYTVQEFFASSPLQWTLQSSSLGNLIIDPSDDEVEGAVTINRANGTENLFNYKTEPTLNVDTGIYENVLYASIEHLFYNRGRFYDQFSEITSSLWDLTDQIYVISIGQDFYGERIKPGSFELSINPSNNIVQDDGYGNLFVSQSGTGTYVGNIFYDNGIAVMAEDTSSAVGSVSSDGVKIISGSSTTINYGTSVKVTRHEANIRIEPQDLNFAFVNPSLRNEIDLTGETSIIESYKALNIPSSSLNKWTPQSLMQAGLIKPYITSIGLYNDQYELLAIAKLSTPIQRTFDADQIFIVRFDV